MRRRYVSRVPLAFLLLVAAGCQEPVTVPGAPLAGAAAAGVLPSAVYGQVLISLAGTRGGRKHGRRLAAFDGAAVSRVRLTATGTDIPIPIVATAPYAADGSAPLEIAIAVPPGQNRLFTLDALDAQGRVVAVMRTLGAVTGGSQRLALHANTDAAARVLASLLTGPQVGDAPDTAGIAASLASSDITASLLTFVSSLTLYDPATNTFSGGVAPASLRDRTLADLLRTQGREVLTAPAPDAMHEAAGSTVILRVVDEGNPVMNADVTLHDPFHNPLQSDPDGLASFTTVPPGTWTLVVETPGKILTTTVTSRDQETAALRTIDMALAGTLVLPELVAVGEAQPFPAVGALPWVETLAGGAKSTARLAALDARVGAPLGQVATDGTGASYVLSYGKVLRVIDANTVQIVARSSAFGAGTGIAGADLAAFALAPDGTAWVADSDQSLYRVSPGELPVRVTGLPALPDSLVLTSLGKLYARSPGRVDEVDLVTGGVTMLGAIAGGGPLAADGAGNLYAWTGSNLVTVAPGGVQSSLGGAAGGDEDGASSVGRFGSVTGLAVGAGVLYVADAANNRIRRVDLASGTISTLAGGVVGHLDGNFAGSAESVSFNRPAALAYDTASQALVVADSGNQRVRRVGVAVSLASTVFALTEPDFLEGERSAARMGQLAGIAVDRQHNVFASDITAGVIWRVTRDGVASRFAGSGQQIARPVTLPRLSSPITAGDLALYAGSASYLLAAPGFVIDTLDQVQPSAFDQIRSVATDGSGRAFALIDEDNTSLVREIVGPTSHAGLLSGLPGGGRHLAVADSGKFYIATTTHVLEVDTADAAPIVRTVLDAEVRGLCVDSADGHVFVTLADGAGGGVIKEFDPVTLAATTFAGDGTPGDADGAAGNARFTSAVGGIAIGGDRSLYVADGNRLRRIIRF